MFLQQSTGQLRGPGSWVVRFLGRIRLKRRPRLRKLSPLDQLQRSGGDGFSGNERIARSWG